jgi:hypothetical protein
MVGDPCFLERETLVLGLGEGGGDSHHHRHHDLSGSSWLKRFGFAWVARNEEKGSEKGGRREKSSEHFSRNESEGFTSALRSACEEKSSFVPSKRKLSIKRYSSNL